MPQFDSSSQGEVEIHHTTYIVTYACCAAGLQWASGPHTHIPRGTTTIYTTPAGAITIVFDTTEDYTIERKERKNQRRSKKKEEGREDRSVRYVSKILTGA